jgi:hypothetical protein
MGNLRQLLSRRLFDRADISSLVAFRVCFGAIMIWEVARYFTLGFIDNQLIRPENLLPFSGFGWLSPWPGDGMYYHFGVLGVFALCVMLGFFYRIAIIGFFLGFTYFFLLDQCAFLNHLYFVSLLGFLMVFLPAGRAFSIDVYLRPNKRIAMVPAWCLQILRFQVATVYLFGAVTKIDRDWFENIHIQNLLQTKAAGTFLESLAATAWAVPMITWGGFFLDLLVVPLLLWRQTRVIAFVGAVLFHGTNAWLFPIGIFPWLMIAATLLFFPPDWPRRVFERFVKTGGMGSSEVGGSPLRATGDAVGSGNHRLILGFLGIYAALQVLVPLRHFLYPGYVGWTEEGHNFSWRMMMRTKVGDERFLIFVVKEPATGWEATMDLSSLVRPEHRATAHRDEKLIAQIGKSIERDATRAGRKQVKIREVRTAVKFTVEDLESGETVGVFDPRIVLSVWQAKAIVGRPPLIHLTARSIAAFYKQNGIEVAVRAESWVSLNGRDPRSQIDPNVDLAALKTTLGPAVWILR